VIVCAKFTLMIHIDLSDIPHGRRTVPLHRLTSEDYIPKGRLRLRCSCEELEDYLAIECL
jgi:hypothetical protein